MPRPLTDIDAGRERLVELARALIEERGSTAITMTELAAAAAMSTANLYRYFENRDALIEAIAEHWFRPMIAIMEEVIASDLPPRRKLYEFFARRFILLKQEWERDPIAFAMSVELGRDNFEQIRSYVDLGDHYLSLIIGEAMAEGHFDGLDIDETLSLINQMVSIYVNIGAMEMVMPKLTTAKLARIVDAIVDGLSARSGASAGFAELRPVQTR